MKALNLREATVLHMEGSSFDDLFSNLREWRRDGDGGPGNLVPGTDVSHYLCVTGTEGYQSYWVEPSPRLVEWITENMIRVDNDSKDFKVIMRIDGSALITVEYNQILGSRWLTIVPASSLPWTKENA